MPKVPAKSQKPPQVRGGDLAEKMTSSEVYGEMYRTMHEGSDMIDTEVQHRTHLTPHNKSKRVRR